MHSGSCFWDNSSFCLFQSIGYGVSNLSLMVINPGSCSCYTRCLIDDNLLIFLTNSGPTALRSQCFLIDLIEIRSCFWFKRKEIPFLSKYFKISLTHFPKVVVCSFYFLHLITLSFILLPYIHINCFLPYVRAIYNKFMAKRERMLKKMQENQVNFI